MISKLTYDPHTRLPLRSHQLLGGSNAADRPFYYVWERDWKHVIKLLCRRSWRPSRRHHAQMISIDALLLWLSEEQRQDRRWWTIRKSASNHIISQLLKHGNLIFPMLARHTAKDTRSCFSRWFLTGRGIVFCMLFALFWWLMKVMTWGLPFHALLTERWVLQIAWHFQTTHSLVKAARKTKL